MVTLAFILSLVFFLSNLTYAEDWTQIGYGGVQGLVNEDLNWEDPIIGIMGFLNLELKHTHDRSWFNYYNRMGILGALEYHTDHSNFSATIQFPFFSHWISKEHLLQFSAGPIWSDAIIVKYEKTIRHYNEYGDLVDMEIIREQKNETVKGISLMILLNYTYPKNVYINSGLLFLRVDYLEKVEARGMIGLSLGSSVLERFSD